MATVFRRVIAGLILGPALLIGSFAWWGFLSLRTVFDESRTQTIAEELLDNDAVVDQISANIGRALESAMPDSIQLNDEQVAAGATIILADPVVRDVIIDSLGTTHRAFLGLDDAPATIDLGPALESSRARIGAISTEVADQIPAAFEVELPTERIPDASPVKRFLERTVPVLGGIALTMALLAFLTTSDRSQVLGKAARWAIGTTAFYLIVGLGVPYLLREFAPDQAEVLAALLSAVLRAALVPSIALGAVGAVLLLLSMFWPDSRRPAARRTRAGGAAPDVPAPVAPAGAVPRPAASPQPAPAPRSRRPLHADATAAMPAAPAAPAPDGALKAQFQPPPTGATLPTRPPQSPPTVAARSTGHPVDATQTPPRPTLPTRAKPPEVDVLPAWTGEQPSGVAEASSEPAPAADKPRWLAPTWVEGHGWVMDPADPREPPNNARHVEGVGWVVPGPPPG